MAVAIGLSYGTFTSTTSTVALTDGTDGFRLKNWVQGTPDGSGTVTETFTLYAEGTDHDDLAANMQGLDDKIRQVRETKFIRNIKAMVKLTVKMDNETNSRQATVLDARVSYNTDLNQPPASPGNFIDDITLVVVRSEKWGLVRSGESAYQITVSAISVAGGTDDFSGDAEGDVPGTSPALIEDLNVTWDSGGTIEEFWIGFRSSKFGDLTNFDSTWEVDNADHFGYDSSLQGVSGASGGNAVRVTFATQTGMVHRATTTMDTQLTDVGDNYGEFLVLLRANTTSTRDAAVLMYDGWFMGTDGDDVLGRWRAHRWVRVNNTDWALYPVGIVRFPPRDYMTISGTRDDIGIRFDAASLGGSGNLNLDCLYMIPRDEGSAYVKGGLISSGNSVTIGTEPTDGSVYVIQEDRTGDVTTPPVVSPNRWSLPPGGGMVVFAGQRTGPVHNASDTVDLTINYNSKWDTIRGADDT